MYLFCRSSQSDNKKEVYVDADGEDGKVPVYDTVGGKLSFYN